MESTVSLKIFVLLFFFFNLIGMGFFLMLMTSIKSFCLLQKEIKQTNKNNVNTCIKKMVILNSFYYQIFLEKTLKTTVFNKIFFYR